MCRWLAYSGGAVPIEELVFKPEHSLVDQSLSAKLTSEPTNADGFGVGWYGRGGRPGVYRSTQPAWNDANLQDLCAEVESGLFLAHVRRSTGSPVQTSNCHPFRHNNWLFVHNGLLNGFEHIRRDMAMAVDEKLFAQMSGSTDSELMFLVALSFGLQDQPIAALEKMVGFIEQLADRRGIKDAVQMTLGVADGRTLYAVRYSTQRNSRTLFHSMDVRTIHELYGADRVAHPFPADARVVASEPMGELPGIWQPIDESSALIVADGEVDYRPFVPSIP